MIKVGQGLNVQQSPKHPGLISRFLQGHQVLNIKEGYHPLDAESCQNQFYIK
jgi:hypothetical protein